LSILRLFIGIAGSSFVPCQYWTSCMFTNEVAGTANALVSGWGNLGGGVTQVVMGSVLFPLFKWMYGGESNPASAEKAWRSVSIVPAVLSLLTALLIFRFSDDSPKGNYDKRKRLNLMPPVSALSSLCDAVKNVNTWILFIQYGCCFGVEVTMNNAAALYFKDQFNQTTEAAAAIASVFGWMNLFARGFGGFTSDMCNAKFGMRGRYIWQFISFSLQGLAIILFGNANTLPGAIFAMILFSVFVQFCEGSTYGIVPYVNPNVTGSVVGIIAAGGNVGGVAFAVMFREYEYKTAFIFMGFSVVLSSILSFFLTVKGTPFFNCWECLQGFSLSMEPQQQKVSQQKQEKQEKADMGAANIAEVEVEYGSSAPQD